MGRTGFEGLRRTAWLAAYAVAMGFLEAAVVVYLREQFYPDGFRFPLVRVPTRIALTEIGREAATIVMLWTVATLAARPGVDRFFAFAFLFGVWDLVYYAGLYVLLGWPPSLGTWDVLFLIPVPWVAPVLCPVLVSVLLVGGYLLHERALGMGRPLALGRADWAVASFGALIVIVSLCWRWQDALARSEPGPFPWWLFGTGLAVGTVPFLRALFR